MEGFHNFHGQGFSNCFKGLPGIRISIFLHNRDQCRYHVKHTRGDEIGLEASQATQETTCFHSIRNPTLVILIRSRMSMDMHGRSESVYHWFGTFEARLCGRTKDTY